MPTSRVRGDYEQLDQIAQAFGAEAEQHQAQLKRLCQVKSLLRGGDWLGVGASKFYAEMDTEVFPTLQRLVNALRQAQQVTEQMSRVIKQAEGDAAACFRGNGNGSASVAGLHEKISGPSVVSVYGQPPLAVFQAEKGQTWQAAESAVVAQAIEDAGVALARVLNAINYKRWRLGEQAHYQPLSPSEALRLVYGGPLTFTRVAEANPSAYMRTTQTPYGIKVYSTTTTDEITKNLVIHELGHAFNNAVDKKAQAVPAHLLRPIIQEVDADGNVTYRIDHGDEKRGYFGYMGKALEWQFGYGTELPGSEEFADMYLGWVYGQWEAKSPLATARRKYMDEVMNNFLNNRVP